MKKENPFISSNFLATKYNTTETNINKILKANNCTTLDLTGVRYRKYNVNDNYFNKIDSHNKAYLLGVWYSDGYLVKEGNSNGRERTTKRIGLDVKDVGWLEDIRQELQCEVPLQKTFKDTIKRLKITSPKMYNDLIKLGCYENKTFLLRFPTEEQVPFEFLNSFILGILDGDGSITIYQRNEYSLPEFQIGITGTLELLQGIQKYLKVEHLKLDKRWKDKDNNNFSLQVHNIYGVTGILQLLYKDAPSFCLKRKKEKFNQIMKDSRIKSRDLMLIPANPNCNGV